MKRSSLILPVILCLIGGCKSHSVELRLLDRDFVHAEKDTVISDTIIYHPVRLDEEGKILPWYSAHLGASYDDAIMRVWNFWKNRESDVNGLPYYMNHQVWSPGHDRRGLGGDQLQMALSSWNLLYDYTGDPSVIGNMRFIADYYLDHSLSEPGDAWPYLPYPYNTGIHSGEYDGDMILGKGYLQPDKGGSFGIELVKLFKKTGDRKYLDAAVKIANTMAENVQPGDYEHSPWPFKVNAKTGETGVLVNQAEWHEGMPEDIKDSIAPVLARSSYTTNWSGTLELFAELTRMKEGNTALYRKAFNLALDWMIKYPVKNNRWGPFFEDIPGWSDTQINAVTFAMYLLEHPGLVPGSDPIVKGILQWVHANLENKSYLQYGVVPTDEQTAYRQPGNSHSSREASVELMYWQKTGDTTFLGNAIRQLNWATYMVDYDGKNFYPTNAVWLTDGYGDYVRHYLRAMAAAPQLAPMEEDHLLKTSSIIRSISYEIPEINYSVYDKASTELFHLTAKPERILLGKTTLKESGNRHEGWSWYELDEGGILEIRHGSAGKVMILK